MATPTPTSAQIQAEFITSLTSNVPGLTPASLQNFFINVTNIRIIPLPTGSKSATPSETSGKWIVIPVPTSTATGSVSPGDVAVDVLAGRGQMQVFNTARVKSGTFRTGEVVLDTALPGFIVPLCPPAAPPSDVEGCVRYPIQLNNPTNSLQFPLPPLTTEQHQTVQLPILLAATITKAPAGPGQPYQIDLAVSDATDSIGPYTGTVKGTVTDASLKTITQTGHAKVNAALAGTNTIVASSDILKGNYTLFLPVAAGVGTLYDFYVAQGTTTIASQRGIDTTGDPLLPNSTATVTFQVKGSQKLGGFNGILTDACTTLPISGATVQILQAPANNSSVDCMEFPTECVSVASATTDSGGNYPIPGNSFNPAPFQQVPIGTPSPIVYTLQMSAPGYDTLFAQGTASAEGSGSGIAAGHCTASAFPTGTATPANGSCSFPLTTSYIQGNVALGAAQPPGTKTVVQVVAENTGTSQLVSALTTPLTIPGGATNLGFTLNVPTHAFNDPATAQNFDFIAVAQDLYQGAPDPFPGHTVLVGSSKFTAPATACATATPGLFGAQMECVGHGSISGTASNADGATAIELLKDGVALTLAPVTLASPAATSSAPYNFCAPPDDTYSVAKVELIKETPTPTPSPTPVGAMSTASPINSPCPSTCFSGAGTCPGVCNPTTGPNL